MKEANLEDLLKRDDLTPEQRATLTTLRGLNPEERLKVMMGERILPVTDPVVYFCGPCGLEYTGEHVCEVENKCGLCTTEKPCRFEACPNDQAQSEKT